MASHDGAFEFLTSAGRVGALGRHDRTMWQYLHRLDRKLGRAAARRQALAERRRQLAEERMVRRHRVQFRRETARAKLDENRTAAVASRQGTRPMTRWELYHWHRQCGTLDVFYMLYPTW